jgi:hypothetical protein
MDMSIIALLISGVSLLVAGAAYRRSIHVKALDLRIELRKADNALRASVESLGGLLRLAKQSHERVMAATDGVHSGNMQIWFNEWQTDWTAFETLRAALPESADYSGFWDTELETKLIAVDALSIRANALRKKYDTSNAKDDVERGRIKDQIAARVLATKKS